MGDTPANSASHGTYTHGHHESVLRSHTWRTAENSADYLLDHLQPSMDLLDVGCGPATITCDFASLVASVIGIEPVEDILVAARATALERGATNALFEVGSVYELRFADNTFDVVHAHQVLQHLGDPVAALAEMIRVTKPGGLVAVRDADCHAMTWYPELAGLDRWMEIYQGVARRNGAEPNAARHLVQWALDAGANDDQIATSVETWLFCAEEERAWWGGLWAERTVNSAFGEQALSYELTTHAEQSIMAQAWSDWAEHRAAWFIVPNGELLIRV